MKASRVWKVVGATAAVGAGLALAWAGPTDARPAVAKATLVDINGNEIGRARFLHRDDGSLLARVELTINNDVTKNLSEFHGFHIHANNDDDNGDGDVNDGCITYAPGAAELADPSTWFAQVDSHWDVGGHSHGAHTGDLPTVVRQIDGGAEIEFIVDKFMAGDLPGRALVVHFQADDYGKHPTVGTSATTGNAGFRYACGLIAPTTRGER